MVGTVDTVDEGADAVEDDAGVPVVDFGVEVSPTYDLWRHRRLEFVAARFGNTKVRCANFTVWIVTIIVSTNSKAARNALLSYKIVLLYV